jgi:hypothetical protein
MLVLKPLKLKKLKFFIVTTVVGMTFLSSQQAQASNCPKEACSGYDGFKICKNDLTWIQRAQGDTKDVEVGDTVWETGGCHNCDGRRAPNNTCQTYVTNWRVQYGTCQHYITNSGTNGLPHHMSSEDTEVYKKSFASHGAMCPTTTSG